MLTNREPYKTTKGSKTWNKIKQWLPNFKQRRQLVPVYAGTGKTLRVNRVNQLSQARILLRSITFVAVITMYIATEPVIAQDHKNALTAEEQAEITPAIALEMLKEGNQRFVKGKMVNRNLMKQVSQTATGQYPHAVVLGCIDSRVPPELVFEIPMDLFKEIPKNSIDFAVMEHTKKGAVVEADLGWSDIGSWKSVHETLSPDGEGNVHDGKVLLDGVKNSLVLSRSDRHIALAGVDDLVVVDTPDALLICSSDASQAVKAIHKQLDQSGADCARLHGPETKAYEGFMRRWTRDWLFDSVLPLWAEKGIDPDLGGAVEALDLNGEPMRDLPRRLRVQTRQTYTFAFAYSMGWEPGLEAMRKPLEYMLKHYRHENGGWIAKVAPNGDPIDESVESYEMAFVILSLGWAAKVTGDQELFKLGEEAVDFLLTRMRHPAGGFVENLTGQPYRRANPHMHLLEAAIHWAELFQHERMFDVTREIYGLYKSHFCVNGLLREYFDEELNLPTVPVSPEHMFVEPGHLMEWAYLLRRYGRLHGIEEETVATLSGFAERYGVCNTTGLLVDHCTTMGDIPDGVGSRLWPQTEAVRFWLDRNGEGDRPRALELLSRMKDHYMTFNGETPGYWRDIIQQDGTAVGDKAPSSSLYHLMGAAEAVLR